MRERNVSRRQFFTVSGAAAIAAAALPKGQLFAQQQDSDPVVAQLIREMKRVHDAMKREGTMRREHGRSILVVLRTYIAHSKATGFDQKFTQYVRSHPREAFLNIDDDQIVREARAMLAARGCDLWANLNVLPPPLDMPKKAELLDYFRAGGKATRILQNVHDRFEPFMEEKLSDARRNDQPHVRRALFQDPPPNDGFADTPPDPSTSDGSVPSIGADPANGQYIGADPMPPTYVAEPTIAHPTCEDINLSIAFFQQWSGWYCTYGGALDPDGCFFLFMLYMGVGGAGAIGGC